MVGAAGRGDAPVRAIAFYLPQFHRIPENDRWWGEGFTEWTNVRRARPLFPGHEQPKAPGALGWYDLTEPGVAERQAALAREHGLHGFCYYFYWFNGKRLLERPLEAMLARGTPDFPFCVCWANENWTRRWDGREQDVLMAQHYSAEDGVRLFDEFLRLFRDPRYIRVDGRPLLLVYKASLIPDVARITAIWRERAAASGVAEPYLVYCETGEPTDPPSLGFDASVEFPPHRHHAHWLNAQVRGLDPGYTGMLTSYRALVAQSVSRDVSGARRLRCVAPSWDNTARQGLRGTVFVGSSPELFGYWVETMVRDTRRRLDGDERLLFVNAWNEWAEGCCLEPDARYGTQYLEALHAGLAAGARLPVVSLERPRFRDVVRDTRAEIDAGELVVARHGATPEDGAHGVSVVMPVYNHERYLGRALASLAAQTLAPCELVAVDDGSSDAGDAVIERFARTAPFPVTLARQRNRGAHVALNRGLALARGRTIALLNSDDEFHPRRLERLSAVLDDATGFAFSDAELIDDEGRPAHGADADSLRAAIARANAHATIVETLLARNVAISTGNFMFGRALLDAIGGFAALEICHDWDFVLAATRHTRVLRVAEPLYRYRLHGGNTVTMRVFTGLMDVERLLRRFLATLPTHPRVDDLARARIHDQVEDRGQKGLMPA
ncbi:Putative glycosyltransferase EpsH [Burkholderiales bacterium]|nr:Putative glycosyltransferase EpsH [Burkholderiales bacterium]